MPDPRAAGSPGSLGPGSPSTAPLGTGPLGTGLALDTAVSRPHPGTVLLEVDGELDALTASHLQAALDDVLATAFDGAERAAVVVDLSGVTFLGSSGLATLIGAARRAEGARARLHLVTATRAVTRPLEVTGADTLFDTHPDLGAALAAAAPAVVAPPPGE